MTKNTICKSVLNKSTIHGLKYIGDTKISKIGRFLWTFVLLLSVIGCAYFSYQIYNEFRRSSSIGVKIQEISSRNVPFPAITICPQSKIRSEFVNYSKTLFAAFGQDDVNEEQKKYFELALPLCTASHIKLINKINPNFTETAALDGSDIISLMSEAQFALNQTFVGIKTDKGFVLENFESDVDRVMTSEGFCATYNLQDYPILFKQNSDLSSDFDSYKNNRN